MAKFKVFRGDTIVFSVAVLDETGAALNCTGGTLKATIKSSLADVDPGLAQITSPAGGIVWVNQATGTATATFPGTATSSLTDDTTVFYDVQYTDSANPIRKTTVDYGTIEVTRDVTTS